jgi:hypothetical protein
MSKIASVLLNQSTDKPTEKLLVDFIKLSLWGNRADLSILKYFSLDIADVTDASKEKSDEMILCDHIDKIMGHLLGLKGGKVGKFDKAKFLIFCSISNLISPITHC